MEKIKELRLEKKLSQKELATIIGCNQTAIGKYERGDLEPNINTLTLLSKYFNVSIDYLIGIEDDFVKPEVQTTLSYKEQKLLKAFNLLEDDEKDKIIEDCEYFANKHTKTNQQRRA